RESSRGFTRIRLRGTPSGGLPTRTGRPLAGGGRGITKRRPTIMAGVVASSTAFLLLLVLLPKNGSVALAAETCYCYQRSAVNGEANKLTKTIALAVGPIELQIKKTVSPVSGCSGAVPTSPRPPPIPADTRTPTPPAPLAADKRGLNWRPKAWCCWGITVATVIVLFAVRNGWSINQVLLRRPEMFLVPSRNGGEPLDGNEHTTMVSVAAQVPTGSRETRRERRSRRMPRPQLRETLIIDSNGNSRLDGNSELFYCPMCTTTAPIIHKSSFGSCGHAFCNSCVAKYIAVRQRENVALPVECPECEDDACRDPLLNSDGDGNEDSSADGNDVGDGRRGDGKHFYCTKCMHVVPCACIRPSFTSCSHDFCSSCVSRQLQGLRRRAGKRPQHQPPVDMLLLTEGNEDLPVDGVGELFDCAICMETVPGTLKFIINSCGHAFCSSCVAQYVAAKLDDNVCPIECPQPGCEDGTIEPESCHGIIPTDLLDKWGLLLCELAVGAKRIYCPYLECSALLLTDGEAGAAAIAEAECPHCHRLFCARCAVPWHDGFGCEEFQKLGQDERGREDLLLRGLVGREGWQRCPECQMFVEKSEGCNYIKCRCGYSFCYRCASELSAQNHYCNKCKR
uniref:RBR-type E3 ubiquitin transferase n=1 Tax=Aegilops tauschii subsp. strangulata TaxID=200361 RepID=A0A453DD63_AEGTS